ncbi:hypothetical protein [Huintestinicola sp.]|uniref:hypothetical protein n=1 Tax=Huintestinicola sp. TaxID=2981661 RepID=UPI003D7E7D2F
MLFFGTKKNDTASVSPSPAPGLNQPVSADDFFKDMGRKPKKRETDVNIDCPEIVGLREEPLPPPGSSIKNIAEMSTDGLADKSGFDDSFIHGNIVTVNTDVIDVDDALAREKAEKARLKEEKLLASQNPDDFFKDIDKRRNRVKSDIAVPEVTGLREAPLPPPDSAIRNIADVSTDGLIDKTGIVTEGLGNISEIDIGAIDTSVLRPE